MEGWRARTRANVERERTRANVESKSENKSERVRAREQTLRI